MTSGVLVRGSALQALAGYEKDGRPALDELQFLRSALNAPAEELRIDTDGIGGGALHLNAGLVHLFAFVRRRAANP